MTASRDARAHFAAQARQRDPHDVRGSPPASVSAMRHQYAGKLKVVVHAGVSKTPGYAALYQQLMQRGKTP